MEISTGNKIQNAKELDAMSTSAKITPDNKRGLGFNFSEGTQIYIERKENIVVKFTPGVSSEILPEEEISKEDKDRFYKMTLRSNMI